MKSFTASAILSIAALSSYSYAAITLGIHKGNAPTSSKRQLRTRSSITEILGNNFTGQSYMATVTVGTPPQDVALAIDTGSSDTWVLDVAADLCTDPAYQAEEETGCQTPYNPKDSSSYKLVKANAFHIVYGDSSGADGDYFTDDFTIGDASIDSLQMGIAKAANLTQGLLGIGYALNEASNSDDPYTTVNEAFVYPNIIDALVSQKLIEINAYSLYLDDLDASTGNIIFGGLDSDKYHGDLVQMPIVPTTLRNGSDVYAEFGVALTSFAVGGKDITPAGSPPAAILDSGTSLTYLPDTLVADIVTAIGGYDDSGYYGTGFIFADCDQISTTKSFDFGFGGTDGSDSVTIKVPYSEMIIEPSKFGFSLAGYIPTDINFTNVCILGIIPATSEPYILGDTFLRSAYVVYDLKNNVVALAQTNFNSTSSSIVDFTADQTAIPAVSGVASNAGIVETATGNVGVKTDTASATGKATPKPTGSGGSATASHKSGTAISPTPTATGSGSGSGSGAGSAGVASVPALDFSGLLMLGGSAVFAMLGGGWLLA